MKLAVLCNDPNVYCAGTVYTTATVYMNSIYIIKSRWLKKMCSGQKTSKLYFVLYFDRKIMHMGSDLA